MYGARVTELLLVRHALPLAAAEAGQQPPLAPEGHRQAELVARWLARTPVDAVVSSPFLRALETAAPIADRFGLEVQVLDDLREWERDGGSPRYTPLEDIPATDPRALALVEGRYADFVPPFDRDAFRARARGALDAICSSWPDGRVVAVSHAGLINTLVAGVLGLQDIFWFLADYTAITRVDRLVSGRTVVRSVNESGHLLVDSASIGRTDDDPSQPSAAMATPA